MPKYKTGEEIKAGETVWIDPLNAIGTIHQDVEFSDDSAWAGSIKVHLEQEATDSNGVPYLKDTNLPYGSEDLLPL